MPRRTRGSAIPTSHARNFSTNLSFSTQGVHGPGRRSRWTTWLKGLYHRSYVLVLIQELSAGADAWWRLGRQREVELFEQDFLIGFWMGIAA